MPDIPAGDITTEVQVVWELLTEDGSIWAQSDAPTAEEAITQTREQLASITAFEERMEAQHGADFYAEAAVRAREVTLVKIRRRTTIQVTAYSTTYSDEQAITETADA